MRFDVGYLCGQVTWTVDVKVPYTIATYLSVDRRIASKYRQFVGEAFYNRQAESFNDRRKNQHLRMLVAVVEFLIIEIMPIAQPNAILRMIKNTLHEPLDLPPRTTNDDEGNVQAISPQLIERIQKIVMIFTRLDRRNYQISSALAQSLGKLDTHVPLCHLAVLKVST